MAFLLETANGGALFAGDVLHLPGWQLADPDRGLVWDVDAEAARATRHRLLSLAADERLILAGAHLGPDGLAWVERDGAGFRARPVG
jgi:glyoxylase-like metal-dependent hydrolase (beta-lactamase superfamily II)